MADPNHELKMPTQLSSYQWMEVSARLFQVDAELRIYAWDSGHGIAVVDWHLYGRQMLCIWCFHRSRVQSTLLEI